MRSLQSFIRPYRAGYADDRLKQLPERSRTRWRPLFARYDLSSFRTPPPSSPSLLTFLLSALRQVYDQMPEPRWVISMGSCANGFVAPSRPSSSISPSLILLPKQPVEDITTTRPSYSNVLSSLPSLTRSRSQVRRCPRLRPCRARRPLCSGMPSHCRGSPIWYDHSLFSQPRVVD